MEITKTIFFGCTCVLLLAFLIFPAVAKNTLEIKGERSEKNICPSLSGWQGRSKTLCYWDETLYHCLLTRSNWYLEVCTKPIQVEPGYYPEISEEFDRLNLVPCPKDRYQPEGAFSNQFKKVTCEYAKAKCNGFGENYCGEGSTTKDSECKCDYLNGYRSLEYLFSNPDNKSCYFKKDVNGGCVMFACSDPKEELNPAYQCVKKCDPGFYRPPDQFNCIQNRTTSTRPTTPFSITTPPATAKTETPTDPVPAYSPPKSPTTSNVEKWKIAGYVTLAVVALVITTLVVYFFLEKFFKIHMKQPSIITSGFNDDVTLKAYVPGFSWFNIEFQWSRIKSEDPEHQEEEIQTDGEQSHFLIRTEGCSSCLTISQVTVQLEAEYVCRANLKCWSRIADKTSTTLSVRGGQFYTPKPSPLPSPATDKKQEDTKFPKLNGLYAPRATMDTDDEYDNKPDNKHENKQIFAGTYIEKLVIERGKHIAIGDNNKFVVTYEKDKEKKKRKSRRKKKKDEDSDDDSSCGSDTPLVEPTVHKPVTNLNREIKNLDMLAQESQYKLKVVDVPGDGHCLYHAFSQSKDMHGLPDDPAILRKRLVKYLESNPNTPIGMPYRDFLCMPLDSDRGVLEPEDMAIERVEGEEDQKELRWQRFLKKIQDGEWGGSLEILGLAQLYNVPVTVLSVGMNGLNEFSFNQTNETALNPTVFIGHLKVGGKGAHFVSFRSLHENAIEQPSSMQQGELHRKHIDSSYPYKDGKVIVDHELDKRIGCIEITAKTRTNGTGFRVGNKYVMTAFHVMKDILVPFWIEVYRRLNDEERRLLRWTAENVPVDGRWNLTNLISSLDPSKQEKIINIAEDMITKSALIKFGYLGGDSDMLSVLKFSYDIPFASQHHDIVILELSEEKNLPPPLILKDTNIPGVKLHVIGHPKGIELQHDPGCKIIDDQEELTELVNKGIDFFTSLGHDKEEVEKDYAPCFLSTDHILFHCSKSTAHGASGSPLIVIKERPQVTGMLLKGHPYLYYNYNSGKEDHPELLVESGISMEKVHSLLIEHSLIQLAEELFSQNL